MFMRAEKDDLKRRLHAKKQEAYAFSDATEAEVRIIVDIVCVDLIVT